MKSAGQNERAVYMEHFTKSFAVEQKSDDKNLILEQSLYCLEKAAERYKRAEKQLKYTRHRYEFATTSEAKDFLRCDVHLAEMELNEAGLALQDARDDYMVSLNDISKMSESFSKWKQARLPN